MYPTEWLILFPRWRYRRAGGDGCDCTVPPPRDRMAAVRVCLQKSHTVGGRPFHASALTITEDTACRYEVSAKQRSFHLQLLCWCMYFTLLIVGGISLSHLKNCGKASSSLDLPTAQDHCLAKSQSVSTLQPFFFLSTLSTRLEGQKKQCNFGATRNRDVITRF